MDTFAARLARLEEHLIAGEPETAEDCLAFAEESFAAGDAQDARFWLDEAKREREKELRRDLEEEGRGWLDEA